MKKNLFVFCSILLMNIGTVQLSFAQNQGLTLDWAHTFEASGAVGSATDKDGNIYSVGHKMDKIPIDFNPGADTHYLYQYSNIFIQKLDAKGDFLWAKEFANPSRDTTLPKEGLTSLWVSAEGKKDVNRNVITDDHGNVYFTGNFANSVNFDPGFSNTTLTSTTSPGGRERYYNIYVIKYNSQGDFQWVKTIGFLPDDSTTIHAIEVSMINYDHNGHIYIAGKQSGIMYGSWDKLVMDVGGANDTIVSPPNFLVKFDTAGTYVWSKPLDVLTLNALAADKDHVYISGILVDGENVFGDKQGDTILAEQPAALFLSKINSSGAHVWTQQIQSQPFVLFNQASLVTQSNSLALDQQGNVYMGGIIGEKTEFSPNTSNSLILTPKYVWQNAVLTRYAQEGFVSKYTKDGNFVWAKRFGKEGIGAFSNNRANVSYVNDLAVNSYGEIYAVGNFSGTIDFDPSETKTYDIVSSDTTDAKRLDVFFVKLDTEGEMQWAHAMGNTNKEEALSLSVSDFGHLFINGTIERINGVENSSNMAIHPDTAFTTVTGPTRNNFFVARYNECFTFPPQEDIAFISGPEQVCLGDTIVYTAHIPGVANTEWTLPQGWIAHNTSSHSIEVVTHENGGTISAIGYGYCDTASLISLSVDLSMPQAVIVVNEFTLSTTYKDYDSWQWYLDDVAIAGAVNVDLVVNENGLYKVVVSEGGCQDSTTYAVNNATGINNTEGSAISIYPNPVKDYVLIKSTVPVNGTIRTIDGRLLSSTNHAERIDFSRLASGVYLLELRNEAGQLLKIEKIIKD